MKQRVQITNLSPQNNPQLGSKCGILHLVMMQYQPMRAAQQAHPADAASRRARSGQFWHLDAL